MSFPRPHPSNSKATFDDVLDALLDRETPFPATYLHRFSDLNTGELSEFKKVFPQVDVSRRRALLEDLEELADADSLVLVENIGRACLGDEDAQVRTLAIRLLWDAEDKKLVPVFINMMHQDPDREVRATAATGLGVFVYKGEVEEIPADVFETLENDLLEVVQGNDDPLVRRRALESLGFSSRPEVPDLLLNAIRQDDTEWVESALFAMGRSADNTWHNEIINRFGHRKSSVVSEAVQAAGELQLETAREPLLALLEETDDDDVRAATIYALAQIGGEGVRAALENLLENSEDDDEISFIEEALEVLDLTEEMGNFDLLEIGEDDEDQYIIEPGPRDADELEKPKKPRQKRK